MTERWSTKVREWVAQHRSVVVTVCAACRRASCWQGIFYCDAYRTATTRQCTVDELAQLKLEHPSYWMGKESMGPQEHA